jgi:hypothetical protein
LDTKLVDLSPDKTTLINQLGYENGWAIRPAVFSLVSKLGVRGNKDRRRFSSPIGFRRIDFGVV